MKRVLLIALLVILSFFQINSAMAEGGKYNNKEISVFVEDVFHRSINIAQNTSLSNQEKKDKLTDLINETVDSRWIAKFVIGKYWRQINKDERTRFIELYRSFLLKSYIPKFQNFGDGEIKVDKIVQQRENVYFAHSKFNDIEQQKIVNVDFRIINKKGSLYITDVVAEGVSFIVTQRSEINASISNNGFDKFMDNLEEMQKE